VSENIKTGPEPEEQSQDTPDRLTVLEHEIKEGLTTYQGVGAALDEIKANKLYKRRGYKTFKLYLQEHWGISRAHAYRLINAAKVAEMSPIGDKPKNEYQARPKEKRSKAKLVSKVVSNLDAEFDSIIATVERWEKALSPEDYRKLISLVVEFICNVAKKEAA